MALPWIESILPGWTAIWGIASNGDNGKRLESFSPSARALVALVRTNEKPWRGRSIIVYFAVMAKLDVGQTEPNRTKKYSCFSWNLL